MTESNSRLKIEVPYDEIKAFCEKWGVSRIETFDSAIRGDFDPETSDTDLLLSRPNPPKVRISLFDEVTMCDDLAEIFGRKVDLVWRPAVERHDNKIRSRSILKNTETIYDTA